MTDNTDNQMADAKKGPIVKVHPVVYMTIVDAYERRKSKEDRALGTLLGYYEKNAIQVTNCYAIPFRDRDTPEINDNFNRLMWNASKRSSPSEQIVGWFYTVPNTDPDCCAYYHSYYATLMAAETTKKEIPPAILLTMDVSFTAKPDRLPVNAYIQRESGAPSNTSAPPNKLNWIDLRVEMDSFLGESIALEAISRTCDNEDSVVRLPTGLDQLEGHVAQMILWLEEILEYINGVLASGEFPEDQKIGRKLMEIVTQACTQLQPEKLEGIIKTSLRDYLMVDYLAALTKAQLALQESSFFVESRTKI